MGRRTRRIYWGPDGHETAYWWLVNVSDAKEAVTLNGNVNHALRAHRGVTVGCALSITSMENPKSFPHPVYLAVFTRTTALIVDRKAKDGRPAHAILYKHPYGKLTDLNDKGDLKKLCRKHPEMMNRQFRLSVPRKEKYKPKLSAGDTGTGHGKMVIPRGAMKRVVMARLMHPGVAEQLTASAKR